MRVLVTRPEPGATATAERLEAMGLEPIKLPLQETVPLTVGSKTVAEKISAIAIPSASAIRHAPRELISKWAGLPCFAVGEATAAVAREAGFLDVASGDGDADSLAAHVVASKPAGTVAYLCGRVRRPIFEQRLTEARVPVAIVETYDTLALPADLDTVRRSLAGVPLDYALVYSANAATLLAERMRVDQLRGLFEKTTMICMSARVADALEGAGGKIAVAAEPSETALLKALRDAVKPAS